MRSEPWQSFKMLTLGITFGSQWQIVLHCNQAGDEKMRGSFASYTAGRE